jgi:hypothetical protein
MLRLKAPSGRTFTCGIFRDIAPGLEVRVCGSSEEVIGEEVRLSLRSVCLLRQLEESVV